MKHRILLLLTIVALMLVMLAMAVVPAFAQGDQRFVACEHAGADHVPFCVD